MRLLRHLPRFRRAEEELDSLLARESWERARIEAFQLERLNRLWKHAVETTRYYRQLRTQLRLPLAFTSLSEFSESVPLLTKDQVYVLRHDLASNRRTRGGWRVTGGSTGEPSRVYWEQAAHLEVLRGRYRFYHQAGIGIHDRMVYLWGHQHDRPWGAVRLRQRLEDRLRGRLRLSAYRVDEPTLQHYLRKVDQFQPRGLYGFTSAVQLLAGAAARAGFECSTLQRAIVTAEPCLPSQLAEIGEGLQVAVAIEYGSIDCGFLAGQLTPGELRIAEDLIYLETLPATDGTHDIVVSVLTNFGFPLLRFQLGDLTDAPVRRPNAGFSRLSNVIGRKNGLLVSTTGKLVHPAFVMDVMEACEQVGRYQLYQRSSGSTQLLIEKSTEHCEVPVAQIVAKLSGLMEGFPISCDLVDRIPPLPAGKHRWIHSELCECHPDATATVPS